MKLKRKIFNIFAAIVMIFGSTPSVFLSAYAAEPAGDAPKSLKTVKSNNDGTYDITLEIEGVSSEQTDITKANVVVVFDSSGSMSERAGQSTRLQVAKNAVNNLASQLLSKNDPSDNNLKDMVEMAFIDFATSVKTNTTHTDSTTDLSTFQRWVNATSANGGTNWEAALNAANNVSFGDNDKTYVIFVSDGNPTFRDSKYDPRATDNCYRESIYSPWICDEVWGNGSSDPNGWNFNAAKAVADAIVADANKELYAVGAFGNANNMANIGGTYYDATDQTALNAAFADIVNKITTGLSVADLQITDGITAATSTEVDGTAGNFRYSVPESWGSDWNGATFDGGSVHWNPGHDKTLTNGEKASVTFTVWPSQEAMNCIAAIRNDGREACAEADLTKFGIGENDDGSFRLITNSTATFKYRTATKVNDEITYSVLSGDVDFDEKRDPTNLPETTLSVVKSWLDSMDADQRKDISEVSVDLYVDRTSESTPERHYTFEAGEGGNEWIGKDGDNKSEYTVAPGVMKKLDGTPATEGLRGLGPVVMVGSDEYVVLEPGHDYEFDNEIVTLSGENGSNHYHITKRKYHPMIIGEGGNIHDVIFSDDGKTAVIDDNLLTKMSLENTLNGGILVGKDVINNGEKDTTITDEYEIKITLTGAEADSGQYRIYTYNEDGTVAGRSDKIDYAGGVITEKIKVNQKIMVTDVPTGTTFEVTETLPDGYTKNEVSYEVIKHNNDGTEVIEGVNEVFGNASSTATVTNYLESGDLKISKEVTATSGLLDKAQEKTFDFTVNFYENQGDSTPVRTDTETCKAVAHNGSCEFENIPAGWYYEIIEAAKPGFNGGEETVKTGTIKAGEVAEVDFENKYAVTPVNTDITILKDFGNFWQNGDEFTFVMTDKDGNETTQAVGFSNHTAVFNVEIPDDGVYEYTVSEVETNGDGESVFRPGVSRLEGDQNIVVRIEAKDKEDGTLEILSVTYSKESQTIYNTYKSTDVSASKIWDDEEDRDGLRENYAEDYFVAVKDNTGKFVAYEKLQTVDSEYSFVGLPATDTRGRTIEYEIAEAKNCSGEGDEIVCTEFTGDNDYVVTISGDTITNKHIPEMYDETGELTVKKLWAGEGNELVRPGSVLVELLADGEVIDTANIVAGQNGEWTYTFEGLYKNKDGKEISYSVQESKIGETAFDEGKSAIVVYDDELVAGKWEKSVSGYEVTNTWTPAKTVYTGAGEFNIKKLDQDGKALAGVTFKIGDKSYTTGSDGEVKVEFSKSAEKPDDKYTFEISETEAPEYYDIIDGVEVLEATTDLDLAVDEENLTNTYTKSFNFDVKTAIDGYMWQNDDLTLLVTDQALGDGLKIEKTFEGISANAFERLSQIEFAISGPDGFEEMTVGNGDDECEITENKLVCTIDGEKTFLPVGEYTVKEANADIDNFTYTSEPASGEIKKMVELGDTAEFEFKNVYEPVKTASYKVKKIWADDNNRDGIRPSDLEVTLLADGEAYGDPVKLTGDGWDYEWTELPLVNEDAEKIVYSAEEENVDKYESDGGKMDNGVFTFTNTHEPEKYDGTGELTVKKLWAGEGNELVRPGSVSVELLADGEVIDKVDIVAGQNNEWTYTFTGLYKNNDGKEISYSVQESKIGETAFEEGKSIIIVYDGERIAGKWEKDVSGYEVTNTWTESTSVYEGEEEFYLEKIDEDGNPMEGVKFQMAGEEYVTDKEGKIKILVPLSNELPDEEVEFVISETETHDGYDKAEGSAVVSLTCDSTLASVDEEALKNTYTKSCIYDKTGSEEYVWNSETKTIVLTNNRSQADSLRIRKVVSGVDREKLESNGLIFTLTGPDDFVAQEIEFTDFTEVEDGVYEYVVEGRIPTGEYTVKEGNAEVYNYTLTVGGDDGESKDVERGDEAIFEIENAYTIIDPCLEGGCGSIDTTPSAPETGRLTNLNRNGKDALQDNSMVAAVVIGTLFLLTSMTSVAVVRRRK